MNLISNRCDISNNIFIFKRRIKHFIDNETSRKNNITSMMNRYINTDMVHAIKTAYVSFLLRCRGQVNESKRPGELKKS